MTYANSDQRIFFVYINVDTVTLKARNINRETLIEKNGHFIMIRWPFSRKIPWF